MNWQVRQLAAAERAQWDGFVLSCPQASFFHRSGWQSIMEQVFGHRTWYLYAEQQGRIGAVLPLALIRSPWFGTRLISLPFCVYGGIAASDTEAADVLDMAAQQLAFRLKVDQLELRHIQSRHADWQHTSLYASFRRALSSEHEQNLRAIPRKQRAMIRKGEALGLRAITDSDPHRLYRNYAQNVHRHGTPVFSAAYFSSLQAEFGADCQILSIEHAGKPVSSVLSFRFRDEILPYYAGAGEVAGQLGANDYMYWKLMQQSVNDGARLFDFGRSKQGTGAYAFKKNWGFQPVKLEYDYLVSHGKPLREVQPLNPRYQWAIRCWRRLPLGLANYLGPHIVRHLG